MAPWLTIVTALPALFREPSWTFDTVHILPALAKRPEYTTDASQARVHVLPLRSPFDPAAGAAGIDVFKWLQANYAPWQDPRNVFVQFQFCDHVTDCKWATLPYSPYPAEFSPASPTRRIVLAQWNGMADGYDAGETSFCTSCVQRGKDIVLPTARNACGPYCGGTKETLRLNAVWREGSPTETLSAVRYVETWGKRPYEMFYAGQVTPGQTNPTADPKHDLSGRGMFYRMYADRANWEVHQTYDWVNNKPRPLAAPMLEFMRNSTFCFSPPGHAGGDQDRYLPALLTGCIPVMLTSVYEGGRKIPIVQPLEDIIPWGKIAVLLDADDMTRLPEVLSKVNVPHRRYLVHKYWRMMLWTSAYEDSDLGESGKGDAVEALIRVLEARAKQSKALYDV